MAQSTRPLTDSFHWDAEDLVIQHDAQELNRVLFSVIEEALQGTEHSDLVKSLYKGCFEYQMKCMGCGHVSGRQEDFLDLSVNVKEMGGLEEALRDMRKPEMMTGGNQYECGVCGGKMDAQRSCLVTSLPQILTISLSRFEFVPQSDDRKKITSAFTFPLELPATELVPDSTEMYELFGVIIHRGTAHHGHYHVYLRDVLHEGVWEPLSDSAPSESTDVSQDKSHKTVQFDDSDTTGSAWQQSTSKRKRLKKRGRKLQVETANKPKTAPEPRFPPPTSVNPALQTGWFDFDDERVRAIPVDSLSAEYGGSSETAYILIYRKVSLVSVETPMIPVYWAERICEMNDELREKRRAYEVMKRQVTVLVQEKERFQQVDGLLRYKDEKTPFTEQGCALQLTLDDTIAHLKALAHSVCPTPHPEFLECIRLSHGFLHLTRSFDSIPEDETLEQAGIKHLTCLIPLPRDEVQSETAYLYVGQECEPIELRLRQGKLDLPLAVNKGWTVGMVRKKAAGLLGRGEREVSLQVHGEKGELVELEKWDETVGSMKWYHSMTLVCLERKAKEEEEEKGEGRKEEQGQVSVLVYDEDDPETTLQHYVSLTWSLHRLTTELKKLLNIAIPLECRLKRLLDNHYFTTEEASKRLYELDFSEGGIRLCLERGNLPGPGEIILKISLNDAVFDVFLSMKSTISQL